ncbi:P63C domain-containing protein [Stigmatella hybrida]|uniref:P63C domain-containing protein n=1 Tax=Stigmatella hybrida TaxID=394097 RepID=UPI001CDAA6AD|nr:P63C domain-containing protein [Stigmatella hybrida]
MDKDPNAVALGKKGGKKGGRARAAKMTSEERVQSARVAAEGRWSLPLATHSGELDLAGFKLPCYVLEDGRRVLSQSGMMSSLDMSAGGEGNTGQGNDRLARFVIGKRLSPFISEELSSAIREPLKFRLPKGGLVANGYEAKVLGDLCKAVRRAWSDGVLQPQQQHIARQCVILNDSFAQLGIIALVDEATGYQYDRARYALAEILEAFIQKELAAWVKTFSNDFYKELFRLRGKPWEVESSKRPLYFGTLTNDIVYSRLAPGVLEELQNKNPRLENGRRKHQHHQWLTRDIGHVKLREHLATATALMKISPTYEQFLSYLDQACPKYNTTIPMSFMAKLPSPRTSRP